MTKPASYEDWMKELQLATTLDDNLSTRLPGIITAASHMGKLNPREARHDIALILAAKYTEEMGRANGNAMLTRTIDKKYDTAAKTLFNSRFSSLLNYVHKNEPNFDIQATNLAQGKTPPGFIGVQPTITDNGEFRAPLGFMKKPARVNEETGEVEPGLGFLDDGPTKRGGLGFL